MTDTAAVEAYLHLHIPISREMGLRVVSIDERGVRLAAPLAPNTNHQSTAFGGSISSVVILAAWTLAHVGLRERGVVATVVIQKSRVEYLRPVEGDFEAFCPMPPARDWERFVSGVERRGRGRIRLPAEVLFDGAVCASFEGSYVAISQQSSG